MDRTQLPGTDVVLEEATADDLPALIDLLADDMLGASRDGIRTDEDRRRYERAFAAIDDDPAHLLVVGRREGQVVTQRGRDLTQRRTALAAVFPAPLLALYEKARERNGGIGAARLVGRRSQASGTELSPADVARIEALPPAAVARCPESGAILVRG